MREDDRDISLSSLLGSIDYRTPVSELRAHIARRGDLVRRQLLAGIDRARRDDSTLVNEPSRILMARCLAALIPDSLEAIATALRTDHLTESIAELQFSIFVALSDIPVFITDTPTLEDLTHLLKEYLLRIDSDMAQAAWMAGDLLGDHWPLHMALPVLRDAVRRATNAAGREGAVHGLSHALGRVSKSDQWSVMTLLQEVATTDPAPSVRLSAQMAMSSMRAR